MDKKQYAEWLETNKGPTAAWLRNGNVSYEQAKISGMLPDQQVARHRSTLAWMKSMGHGNTPEARHLRHAVGGGK